MAVGAQGLNAVFAFAFNPNPIKRITYNKQ